MKPGKGVMAVLCAVLLVLAVMVGFFLGRSTVAGPVRAITRVQAAQLPEDSGTREVPAPQSTPSEGDEPAEPAETGEEKAALPLDINTATAEELQALPGIGEARAEAIVAYREAHGPFTHVEDLRAVSGIGEGILADIMDYITVGEQNNG